MTQPSAFISPASTFHAERKGCFSLSFGGRGEAACPRRSPALRALSAVKLPELSPKKSLSSLTPRYKRPVEVRVDPELLHQVLEAEQGG